MNRTFITSLFPIAVALLLASCGGNDDPPVEREFHLADVRAENLRLVGMAKKMEGDTIGMSRTEHRASSPEGSKVAYCRGKAIYVADADGKTSKLLYDGAEEADVQACYNLRWSPTGEELSFTQAKQVPGDSLRLMTVVLTLGRSSENE